MVLNRKKSIQNIDEDFIKNSDEDSDKGHILEADVKYPKFFLNLHGDLHFLA